MKKILFVSLLFALFSTACNSHEEGNPPAGDEQPDPAPKDFDTMSTGKDTMLLPH